VTDDDDDEDEDEDASFIFLEDIDSTLSFNGRMWEEERECFSLVK